MSLKNLFGDKPGWVTSVRAQSATSTQWHYEEQARLQQKYNNEAQRMGHDVINLAIVHGVSPKEMYRFFVESLGTDEGAKRLLTWRATKRLTE